MPVRLSRRLFPLLVGLLAAVGLVACSTRKNTAGSRFYHQLTTRYNVYHNGRIAYDNAYKKLVEEYQESYSEQLLLDPIAAQRGIEKKDPGGPFNQALEKGRKAIRMHSIRVQPEGKQRSAASKREYNAFIYNAWLLVGCSQFYNGDFLDALSTFGYMARLYRQDPPTRDLARLWQARCYTAMGWTQDAHRMIDAIPVDAKRKGGDIYHKTMAELALAEQNASQALSHLSLAIKEEKLPAARTRMRFLEAQLLFEEARYSEASKRLSQVLRSAPPFPLELAARLKKVEITAVSNRPKAVSGLQSMSRHSRYREVLDAVYLAEGHIHLAAADTTAALKALELAGEKSVAKGGDFAIAMVTAAQLYYARGEWLNAQRTLSEGIGGLREQHPQHSELQQLSQRLDALAIHAKAVSEQDSLRHLASLPEEQRLAIIDSAITAYEKQKREMEREAALAEQREKQGAFNEMQGMRSPQGLDIASAPPVTDRSFYFYNDQLIAQGKNEFRKKWGNRTLEDNWRRRNKQLSAFSPVADPGTTEPTTSAGEEATPPEGGEAATLSPEKDPTKREFYLVQLPFTEEAMAASDVIIQNGLLGMSEVFEGQMEQFTAAIETLRELLRRYPEFTQRLQVYYRLFMLASRLGLPSEAAQWRVAMQNYYPENPLTKAISTPAYFAHLKGADSLANDAYDQALEAYLDGRYAETQALATSYLQGDKPAQLEAKFRLLDALSDLPAGRTQDFAPKLQRLVERTPQGEVAELAQGILAELKRGRALSTSAFGRMNYAYMAGDTLATDSLFYQLSPRYERHMALLFFQPEETHLDGLAFAIASFNFSQFTELSLSLESPQAGLLIVRGFPNAPKAWQYVQTVYSPAGYLDAAGPSALMVAMGEANWKTYVAGLGLAPYLVHLSEQVAEIYPAAALPLNRMDALKEAAAKQQTETSAPAEVTTPVTQLEERTVAPEKEERPIPKQTEEKEEASAPETQHKVISQEAPTLEDIRAKRAERLKQEKLEAKQKKEAAQAAEKARRKAQKEREEERRKQQQERLRKQREREKARRTRR